MDMYNVDFYYRDEVLRFKFFFGRLERGCIFVRLVRNIFRGNIRFGKNGVISVN